MTNEFTMTGFNHIKGAGVIEFWQLLNMKGSIDLLWDMPAKVKINALMQSKNFYMDAHIKTNYKDDNYDEAHAELHDEMVETITALEFCFATNTFSLQFNGRNLSNLNKIPESPEYCPEVYYPIAQPTQFEDRTAMEKNVFGYFGPDNEYVRPVKVRVLCIPEDTGECCSPQDLIFEIDGAGDYNFFLDLCDQFEEAYACVTYTRIQ